MLKIDTKNDLAGYIGAYVMFGVHTRNRTADSAQTSDWILKTVTYKSMNFAVGVLVVVRSMLIASATYLDRAPRPHLAVRQRLAHGEDVSLVHVQVVRLRARVLEMRAHEERVTHATIVDDVIVALPAVTDEQVHLTAHAH